MDGVTGFRDLVPRGSLHNFSVHPQTTFTTLMIPAGSDLNTERWSSPHLLQVGALTDALLDRLTARHLDPGHQADLLRVLRAMLAESEFASGLPMPTGARTSRIAAAVLSEPGRTHELADFARSLSVSTRTLSRDFLADTGMTYSTWLVRVRMEAAVRHLRDGAPTGDVARAVGYRTTSGFIDAFRAHSGTTPGRYALGLVRDQTPAMSDA